MKIKINMRSDMEGIYFVELKKGFSALNGASGPKGFPKTSKEAIERIIEELQKIVKKEIVKQCYTCGYHEVPSAFCKVDKENPTFKESHDTCLAWTEIKKCYTCHNYHTPTSICQNYSETEDPVAKMDPENTCKDWKRR